MEKKIKLCKVLNIKKVDYKKKMISFEGGVSLKDSQVKFPLKANDYVFLNFENSNPIKGIEWLLYNRNQENNVFEVYQKYRNQKSTSSNYALSLNKFTNIFVNKNYNKNLQKISDDDLNYRSNVAEEQLLCQIDSYYDDIIKLQKSQYNEVDFTAKVLDKLIIGLGDHSVFETDIRLHHTYGVPYIPASTLKGCLRSRIIKKYFDSNEERAKENPYFTYIFGGKEKGNKHRKGCIMFLDAFPQQYYKTTTDIMTPHYSGGIYRDDQNPTPIQFLTIYDTRFRFVLLIEKEISTKIKEYAKLQGIEYESLDENSKEFVDREKFELLSDEMTGNLKEKGILEEEGIGAKTSVGYGFFTEIVKQSKLEGKK